MAFFESPTFFWICATALTLIAIASAVWPLLKTSSVQESTETAEGTEQVFLDQLQEIERDRERGLIGDEEADSARAEVGRRLLALKREDSTTAKARKNTVYPWFAIAMIPIFAVSLYTAFGAPGMQDQPISKRLAKAQEGQDIQILIARVERHLEKNPKDIRGWTTLGPIYQRLGQLNKAEDAFRRIIALEPKEKELLGATQNALGQLLAIKTNGQVTKEARALFVEGRKNAPEDVTSYFFEALALTQEDKKDEAIAAWELMLARFKDANESWLNVGRSTLARLKGEAVQQPRTASTPAPVADDETRDMINGMVEGLAAKLEDAPDDGPGWARLIRSYMVLKRPGDAANALKTARNALKENDQGLKMVEDVAKEFDL